MTTKGLYVPSVENIVIQRARANRKYPRKLVCESLRQTLRKKGHKLICDLNLKTYDHDYLDRAATRLPRTFKESKIYSSKRIKPDVRVAKNQNQV